MKTSHLFIACLINVFLTVTTYSQNSPAPRKLIEFVLTPDAADWNYKVNQNAAVQVSVFRYGVPMKDATVTYEMGPEMLPAEKKEPWY